MSAYTEWYNENEGRAWPLVETCSRTDDNGVIMANNVLADISVTLPAALGEVFVSSVALTPYTASISLATALTGIAVGTFYRSQLVPHQAYALTAMGDNIVAWVVFGTALAAASGSIHHRFRTVAQSGLDPRTTHVIDPPSVTRFFKDGGRAEVFVDGDVRISGNTNIKVVADTAAMVPTLKLVLDPQAYLAMLSPCKDNATKDNCSVPPIRTINGVGPDEDGIITVRFE